MLLVMRIIQSNACYMPLSSMAHQCPCRELSKPVMVQAGKATSMDKARLGAGLDYSYPTSQHLDGTAIFLGVSSAFARDHFGFGAIAAVNRLGIAARRSGF